MRAGGFPSVRRAIRHPGWGPAVAIDPVAVRVTVLLRRWMPGQTVVAIADLLIASATASVLDNDLAEQTQAAPVTLRRRAGARLTLAVLLAIIGCILNPLGAHALAVEISFQDGISVTATLLATAAAVGSWSARKPRAVRAARRRWCRVEQGSSSCVRSAWSPPAHSRGR
jgi:hypothetical protein